MRPPARGARAKRYSSVALVPPRTKAAEYRAAHAAARCSVAGWATLALSSHASYIPPLLSIYSNPPLMMPRSQTSTCEIAARNERNC